ncbi:hypothetical protein [Actinomadura rudentiformis]|uniref:Uncharacterized protein n=1 Tax=Actinomadura rudentiformis TaxID=359158 RepID=A0A6H9YZX0_9ACTN|nr:hypothetical protein [Actinomadura rudentiformis]KAB2347009.1 hypothetical protein F8566_22810 [Actinomadura rudentiformis]
MTSGNDRAAFRAWIRANHPDAGGDPEVFATGLRRRRPAPAARAHGRVTVVRRRRGPGGALQRWLERRRRRRARKLN